ncbi:hypothetical protein HW555_012532 [Spodoptera exigua]|uniref:LIM zinc-binding domain-containing protein n=1 Tax=Spodoptera exigua TaxID=7107 RepID=A0A835G6W5_SPOEX|nr:hypothetical protein HW555_012532 [Spodoptera exigua]
MACEICEHCQSPLCRDERMVMRDGYSYHKKCHKCYVCSETDLVNAEVFKGVIFCSGCAQRIFQGCFTARRIKTSRGSRGRKTRSKSKRRDRVRPHVKRQDGSRDGVIELARLHGSVSTLSTDVKEKQTKKTSKAAMTIPSVYGERGERKIYEKNCYCVQPVIQCQMQKCSTEMGTTTDVTQELLRQINCVVPDCDSRLKNRTSCSLSVLNQESDVSGDRSDWVGTPCSTVEESVATKIMDRRLGSIIKMPLKFFKKNILTRSSLVSILMSADDCKIRSPLRHLKRVLYEEVAEHQSRGVRRLYSTINRRKTPYKLGWNDLVANVSKIVRDENVKNSLCVCSKQEGCKHLRDSHSYRCMRAQVMKIAGPTPAQ